MSMTEEVGGLSIRKKKKKKKKCGLELTKKKTGFLERKKKILF